VKAYWAAGHGNGNFGDLLTPIIFHHAGLDLEWSEREDAELFAVGSIAEMIPPGFTGFVLGSGSMFGEPVSLAKAKVLALRGVRTARAAGIDPPILADLALIATDALASRPRRDIPIGTVRTGSDPRPPMGTLLDPENGDPEALIALMARCQRIVSSSLHGLIVADALGITNMWDPYMPADAGSGFKFMDYASAYGERIAPFTWRLADQRQVQLKQMALREAVQMVVAAS
jgi:pyruvyltransferase